MTFDNGIENKYHQELKVPTFFCDPYSSWQKGGVENVNNKPRKILKYKTAYEMAMEHGIILDGVS
jgi:IS30 family transposase